MKEKSKLFGFVALALITCFIIAGCPKPDPEDEEVTVTSVTIDPETVSVAKNSTQQFRATVTGENNPAQTVTWTIVETGKASGTNINANGLLTVATAENLTSLTVKATSTVDTTKYDTATVNIVPEGSTQLTGTVTISGTLKAGQTLTANTTSLNASGTIKYQWMRGDTSSGTFSSISNAKLSTYTLASADIGKYIKVTVDTTGNTGNQTSAAFGPVHSQFAVDSTSALTSASNASTTVTEGSRDNVIKIDASKLDWMAASYDLSAYKDKEIILILSVDVKREGAAGTLQWQINNSNYPTVASQSNAAVGTWYTMSGVWKGTPSSTYPALYLNNDKTSGTTFYYIDNFTITIVDPTALPVETGDGFFDGEILNSKSKEQETRKVNGYDYELWNEKLTGQVYGQGNANMTIAKSGNSENGGIFKCDWDGIKNVLFRAGRKYNQTQTHSQIGTFSIEYDAPVFNLPGGSGKRNAYLSVYGWVSGGATDPLIEYYIVDSIGEYNPKSGAMSGTLKTITIDGEGTYDIFKVQKTDAPSINKNKDNFVQYFSVRTSNRTSGTISVTKHFEAWAANGMTGITDGKLYEVALKVESYGGDAGNAIGNAEVRKNILKVNGMPIN